MEAIKFIQSFSTPFLDHFFKIVTDVGGEYFPIVAITILYWCVDKKFGYKLGFAFITTCALNVTLKEIFQVPRPIGQPGIRSFYLESATGYSFPSGHTQSAATFWTSLMVRLKSVWIYIMGITLIIMIAISRIYLGVHTLADVIVGGTIGVLWAFVSNKIYDYTLKKGKKGVILTFVIPILAGMFLIHTGDYYKVAAVTTSFIIGLIIEPSYIRFKVRLALWKQVIKYTFGIVVLLGLEVYIKTLLPYTPLAVFLGYFLMGIWITTVAPFVFSQVFGREKASSQLSANVKFTSSELR